MPQCLIKYGDCGATHDTSMAGPDVPSEERELSLIGKVELRIALADTDAKVQAALKTYLAPLLLKLASPHLAVRNKVISICSHINLRIQPETIQLPVADLVKQYKEHSTSSLLRHFDLLYIKQGTKRLTPSESATLFPVLIKGIESDSNAGSQEQAASWFNFALHTLHHYKLPERGSEQDLGLRRELDISDADADYLATWIGRLVLLQPSKAQKPDPPGLAEQDYNFLTPQKEDTWDTSSQTGLSLSRTKVAAVKLLASGIFKDSERFFPALFASADPISDVCTAGEDIMKRGLSTVDFEDDNIIAQLFAYFFGQQDAPRRISRVRPPLRLKIFGLLTKSVKSTNYRNEVISMVQEGMNIGTSSNGPDAMQIDGAPPSQGREAMKLRAALFAYINHVARFADNDTLNIVAPIILERLRDYIESQGWSTAAHNEDTTSRALAYEIVGLLGKAGPSSAIVEPNLRVIRWLFESLANDKSSSSIVVSIEEALASVMTGVSRAGCRDHTLQSLEELLLHQMLESLKADRDPGSNRRSTRYAALRFANRCLPFDSIPARRVNLLAISAGVQERHEVGEEGRRGLSPYWYGMINGMSASSASFTFPRFTATVLQLFGSSTSSHACKELQSVHTGAYVPAILFCRSLLLHEAFAHHKVEIKLDNEWERSIDARVRNDHNVRDKVKDYINSISEKGGNLATALKMLFQVMTSTLVPPQSTITTVLHDYAQGRRALTDFCGLCPDQVTVSGIFCLKELMSSIYSNQIDLRETAAHAFGIFATHPDQVDSLIQPIVEDMLQKVQSWRDAVGAAANKVHGSTLALGYYYSRQGARASTVAFAESDFSAYFAAIKEQMLHATDSQLRAGAMQAFGELCLFQVVQFPTHISRDEMRTIVDKTADLAKTGIELASLTLGKLSVIVPESTLGGATDHDDDLFKHIEDRLHKLHEVKQAEVHFAVGEALSYLVSGWSSLALANAGDVPRGGEELVSAPRSSEYLQHILEKTLRDCANTKPSLRKASVIWLLCLVEFCGHLPVMQSHLGSCQMAFKRTLTDRDDLIQETAARGLGLVYEKGDRKLRDDLVRDLVGSFANTDKRNANSGLSGQVGAETQLFEQGALPTGSGESITTYKDIMNLAAEVGDSSLVYRFMSMASSNAIWSSRAAFGRFGLSSVLSDSSVDGYLSQNPKLYQSLYRYRFDPSDAVRRSMNDIWNSLVKDTNKTIELHFDAILEDLLSNILGREWRTRQACCAAIADLIQGRPLTRYETYLERIWNACFKVLDDVKETVRTAAASLVRVLTGILTNALESNTGASSASKMLKQVLPFLLSTSGIESSAQDVQSSALRTLLKIIKKSSPETLRPFTPDLIERLLGLLSTLEPQEVNYLHLNADKYNITQQKIDDVRLSSVRSSPLMEACERCLACMDAATMALLQPRLISAIKSAVGLPSKVGGSRLLVSLSTQHNQLFKPHADSFLSLIEKIVLDRNETVASSFAVSAGYVARCASDDQILALVKFAKRLYFDSPGDRDQAVPRRAMSAAELLNALSKHATDRFERLAASLLPFVFVGRHDTNDAIKQIFDETWAETVAGPRAVSLYLKEILALVEGYTESPQWAVKYVAAKTIAGATSAMVGLANGAGHDSLELAAAIELWPRLEKVLGGKTWDGKEIVVEALVKFVKVSGAFLDDRPDVAQTIDKIAIREAKRRNPTYQLASLPALGEVAAVRLRISHGTTDLRDLVHDTVVPILDDALESISDDADQDKMDVDDRAGNATSKKLIAASIDALVHSIQPYEKDPAPQQDIAALKSNLRRTLQIMLRVRKVLEAVGATTEVKGVADWIRDLQPCLGAIDEALLSVGGASTSSSVAELQGLLEHLA